ncbi:MAG: 3'(2'),5'-bisphosphate nucleotidase CysQ [Beijerinckiaceae bacterium]
MPHADDLALLLHAARKAGDAASAYFSDGKVTTARVSYKDGNSPVSEADYAANAALESVLRGARPDYGWISEETVDAPARLSTSHVFIVDPIDGTRAFIAGKKEWSVAVALVVDGHPVAGVVHAPELGRTYHASLGKGAFCNGQKLTANQPQDLTECLCAGPVPLLDELDSKVNRKLRRGPRIPSLAYRLVLAASGEVDLAFASVGAHDWDVAGADIILREAGAVLVDEHGKRLVYNQQSLRRGLLVAGGEAATAQALLTLGL